jgi:DNA-binding Xre family transcriptional regulator
LGQLKNRDLAFYDGVAANLRAFLDDSRCAVSVAELAEQIGWNRSGLSNFLRRKTKTIPAHLLVRVGKALKVPVGDLMTDPKKPSRR